MLLQFFYTGEVSMTQRDIEPLRELCLSLGIHSLMTRLDEVKLSISFQNIPRHRFELVGKIISLSWTETMFFLHIDLTITEPLLVSTRTRASPQLSRQQPQPPARRASQPSQSWRSSTGRRHL